MNKKILCGALLGALGLAHSAVAQDFDDRWYVSGSVGIESFDDDRNIDNDYLTGGIGFGKFFAPNWSFDAQLESTNPRTQGTQLNWSMYSASLVGRYHFKMEDSNWWPYVSFGAGVQRHEDEFSNPRGGRPLERKGNDFLAQIGGGLQGDFGRTSLRLEASQRLDTDDESGLEDDFFADTVFGVSVLVKFGETSAAPSSPTSAPEVPAAPVKTCADMDDDGDGVNNCNDKCPDSQAGQTVGPDGCPVPVTIDLRGVNFDFDKSTLRPDAVAILTEAVSILTKYPELRVEVAGHTDAVGTDAYNQGLSERRARAVYDYLTSNGIAASRLAGPNGFGEGRPIDTNDTDEGRARNRRTELNVQN
ncbi:MAG: OmpA family protein [Pseudomarimonas sp.]